MSTNEILDSYIALRREIALLRASQVKQLEFGHNQIGVLYRLSISDATMGELTEYALSDKASMTRTVRLLEQAGLIQRTADKNDRRIYNIKLTAKGKPYAKQAQAIRNSIGTQLDEALTVSERKQFNLYVQKIVTHLNKEKK